MPQNNTSSSSLLGRLTTSTRSSFMSPKDVRCNVHLLHDSDIIGNEFPRTKSAQTVLDYVCDLKNIQEKDFLGLRYQDHNKHRYWLDLTRSIGHVIKHFKTETMTLHLRFRYYPLEPARLRDPNLRYQLFVQLQRDLLHGRLYCPATAAAELAALILQVQLGDYDEEKHQGNYVSEYKLLLKQTPKLEERIAVIHKEIKGKSSTDAETEFLEKASQLDTYAFDPYTIKDSHDPVNPVYLGASCKGILIYAGQSRTHHIEWPDLAKVDYSGKELKLTLSENYKGSVGTPNGTLNGHVTGGSPISGTSHMDKYQPKKPITLKYQCPSGQFAKHLWIHILSQQAFFNESAAHEVKLKFSKPRIPLISRGSTFRFPSKRVYREIEEEDGRSLHFDRTLLDNSMNLNETINSTTENDENNSPLNCSIISAPTSTITSSSVVRYELTRQTPRAEQPWLAKGKVPNGTAHFESTDPAVSPSTSGTETHNNNQPKLSNLNVSFDDPLTSSPIPSVSPLSSNGLESIPKVVIHTQQTHAEQNSTSFTVHLIKRETVSTSITASSTTTTSSELEGVPRHQECPPTVSRAQVLERKFQEIVEQDVDFGRPLASSTPRSAKQITFEKNGNGKVANGDSKTLHNHTNGHTICTEERQDSLISEKEEVIVVAKPTTKSTVSRVTNTVFVVFLTFLLILAIVICVFEKSDGSAHNDFIENHAALSELRHGYYEPARHYVVDRYRKYFGAKI